MIASPLYRLPILAFLCAGVIFAGPARAQPSVTESSGKGSVFAEHIQGLLPPAAAVNGSGDEPSGEDTHPMIRMTPDKSELVHLDQDAESVIVGNPNHLGVLMDNRRLLILVPRQPGATYLTVLDGKGNIIMQRHVLVAVAGTDYVRIRRSCSADAASKGCQTTSVYYCPGMCHEVGIIAETDSGDVAPVPPASGGTVDDNTSGDAGADGDVPESQIPDEAQTPDTEPDAGVEETNDTGNPGE